MQIKLKKISNSEVEFNCGTLSGNIHVDETGLVPTYEVFIAGICVYKDTPEEVERYILEAYEKHSESNLCKLMDYFDRD